MTALSRTANASQRRVGGRNTVRETESGRETEGFDVRMIMLRHGHHARASGYDRLADYIPSKQIWPVRRWSLGKRAIARICRPLVRNSGLQWYHRDNLLAEMRAGMSWYSPGRRIYHYLYGENSFRYLGALKRTPRAQAIICTFHTPKGRLDEVVKYRKHLGGMDACITLTQEMRGHFRELLESDRVFFIPHGVDTQHFTPAEPRADVRPECLAVGSHMRDYEALAQAARILYRRDRDVTFTIVAGKGVPSELQSLPNTRVLINVSDEGLSQLYQQAALFLLPVREVTANNALLEAMACGLPVIATDLPGVRDYVSPGCARLVGQADGEAMADTLQAVLYDDAGRHEMARAARSRALELDWERVAEQVRRVYEEIATR